MKTETVRISKAVNGYIISNRTGVYIAKDKKELNLKIAESLDSIIPLENDESIELDIILKN